MDNGYIKLFRKFRGWEWYKDQNVKSLFLHLLLTANFTDKNHKGIEIKRGQVLTSIKSLEYELGLKPQPIRTALNKLKRTNEITIKSTNKYSLVTVLKYEEYQSSNKQNNNPLTVDKQSNNNQLTTTKKEEERKEFKNVEELLVNAVELIKEEFRRPLRLEEVTLIERWVMVDKYSYDEIWESLFYIIKTEDHRDDIIYMYGILKNRRKSQKK